MKQGIAGLAIGVVLGTVLAGGAAFAMNTPGHIGATSGTAVAPAAVIRTQAASHTPTGSADATASVRVAVSEARHAIEKPKVKKAPRAKKKAHHTTKHATRSSRSSTRTRSVSRDTDHNASGGTNHAPTTTHDEHAGDNDGGSCD